MDLLPAIDLRGGRVVRLAQGAADREADYGDDPAAQAESFAAAGARWLHLVDLDRAFGSGDNDEAIAGIVTAVGSRLSVQVGGGVRSLERAASLLDLGVTRVIIGTAAVDQPEFIDALLQEFGASRIVVGIDAREGLVAVRGWVDTSVLRATELAGRVARQGIRRVIYTDIARDGMLGGPDIEGSRAIAEASGEDGPLEVIVSGGIATLADLQAVARAGLPGVIIGRALYEGRFELAEALATVTA
ncbi:MAG: 1-(5-phosphoribosyl)-5-[(5-phosphoribosylamino)methylideneamino]imidazole-4-carboxamide isomerase [Gemmatimonadota bacterium]